MSNEKELLIRLAINKLEAQIVSSEKSIKQEQRLILSAPTSRESWSDTSRSQIGRVVQALQAKHFEMQQALTVLRQLKVRETTIVEGGALVEIEEEEIRTFYLIVPGILRELELNGKVIEIISPASPVARALFGHKVGEIITIKVPACVRTLKILGIK